MTRKQVDYDVFVFNTVSNDVKINESVAKQYNESILKYDNANHVVGIQLWNSKTDSEIIATGHFT